MEEPPQKAERRASQTDKSVHRAHFDDRLSDAVAHTSPDALAGEIRSDLHTQLEIPFDCASTPSHAVLFSGSFNSVYQTARMTPAQALAFAAKYLVNTNRNMIDVLSAPGSEKKDEKAQ